MPRRPSRYALLWIAVPALLLSSGASGCHKPRSSIIAPEQPTTTLYVTNSEFLDAVVYVVNRGQRVRLGVATSNQTTRFVIPPHVIFGATPLSFLVDPIGGKAKPSTADMVIDPGDDVELRLDGGRVVLTKR
jgi:hypothetical protein